MSQEQSIDEILKLLKESISDDELQTPKSSAKSKKSSGNRQANNDVEEEEGTYSLDYDFLKEVSGEESAAEPTEKKQRKSPKTVEEKKSREEKKKPQPKKETPEKPQKSVAAPKKVEKEIATKSSRSETEYKDTNWVSDELDWDVAPWEEPQSIESDQPKDSEPEQVTTEVPMVEEQVESQAEESVVELHEDLTDLPVAMDFDANEANEEEILEYELLPKLDPEEIVQVIEQYESNALVSLEQEGEAVASSEAFEANQIETPASLPEPEQRLALTEGRPYAEKALISVFSPEEMKKIEEFAEFEQYVEEDDISLDESIETVENSFEEIVELQPAEEFEQAKLANEFEEETDEDENIDESDRSVYELMLQFGCEEELEIEDELKTEDETPLAEEYQGYEQTEKIRKGYQKRTVLGLLRLSLGIAISIFLFFYDTLPLFPNTRFSGIANYRAYPGSYAILGFQILLIGTLLLGKPLARGVKRLLTLHADIYSMIALTVLCTGIYDVVAMLTSDSLVPAFHFVVSLLVLSVEIGEFILLRREIKSFSVFSGQQNKQKFSLRYQETTDPLAQKLRRGGYSEEKRVASPVLLSFPKGFVQSIREDYLGARMVPVVLIPVFLLSVLAAVVAVFLEEALPVAMASSMVVLLSVLPLSLMAAAWVPLWISSVRLKKRGIALTGQRLIDQYAKTDLLVFREFHLFQRCTPKNMEIVFFDHDHTAEVLGCLERLFSEIGSPMGEAFGQIPEQYRMKKIRVRRITKGGTEAFIDRKHILLVGDLEFMKRYGLEFPNSEATVGRVEYYISLDGNISAKLSVKYTIEPIFEMLVERLAQQGVACAVETYDPMLRAAKIAEIRTLGGSPIHIIHRNASELNDRRTEQNLEPRQAGMVVTASRLKLAEAVIWCKKLKKVRQRTHLSAGIFSVLGVLLCGTVFGFGMMSKVNQYWVLLWNILANLVIVLVTIASIPKKGTFSVEQCRVFCEKRMKKQLKRNKTKKEKKEIVHE